MVKKYFTGLFVGISFILLFFARQALAIDQVQSTGDRATVVPAKFELWTNPGDKLKQTLRITNEDDAEAIIALSIQGFGIAGEDGEVVFGDNYHGNFESLVSWITFDQKSAVFAPKETKMIGFEINVPKDAEAGGKYASIVVSMDRVNRQPNASLSSAKVMSILMLSVSGDTTENASIGSFGAKKISDNRVEFSLRISNAGNDHIKPKGILVITNLWGKKVDEVSLSGENVLPNTTRKMISTWSTDKHLFGRYTATLVSVFGDKEDHSLSGVTVFYVFSKPILAGLISIIILISLTLILFFRHKDKIIKKISSKIFRR